MSGQVKVYYVTLHTTLMPSMSSGERVLICDVPLRNCSDSDIPVGWKHRRTNGFIHSSIPEIGPVKGAEICQF